MNGASVTDLILRSIAAMRERGDLPEFEPPTISVARLSGSDPARFRFPPVVGGVAGAAHVHGRRHGELARPDHAHGLQ